jgi:hypothetical protein
MDRKYYRKKGELESVIQVLGGTDLPISRSAAKNTNVGAL